jgi:hypothetical protein
MKTSVLKSNTVNLNGRMYTDECLEQMVAQFKQKVSNGVQMFGELGYPESTSFTSLERVSHQVENLQVEGDTLFAEIKVLDTPRGKELKTLLDDIVFRPRMIGHVLEDNTVRVDNLISFDAILKETDSYKDIL